VLERALAIAADAACVHDNLPGEEFITLHNSSAKIIQY
jgi:hypothetical protein